MLEIEVKYRVDNFDSVAAQLRQWGAPLFDERDDADTYFNAPHRDFARTDEALRIRQIGVHNFVTYKGPRIDRATKTRKEIEIPLGDGAAHAADLMALLIALGFSSTATVRKHRRVYSLQRDHFDVEICLDQVEHLGKFVEIEIMAPEVALEPALDVVNRLAAELQLTASERRSYLELLLQSTTLR